MQVRHIMTSPVELAAPDDSVRVAARKMVAKDCGILPVAEDDRLIGMVSDRDIVMRAVAEGFDPDECYVREIMTTDVKYCYDDETAEDLARNMASLQVKRLPVLNRDKRLVGIVSLGDLALVRDAKGEAQTALAGISQPGWSTLDGTTQAALF
jgi:CBS domain-containing protein